MNTRHRVMLVDDDLGLLQLLSIRLDRAGFMVASAPGGEEALALMPAFKPHVVVTDLRMEGMDGMTLFEEINSHHPMLPIIVLTAHGTIPGAVDATRRGVFAYLTKPYDGQELVKQIRQALAASGADTALEDGSEDVDWRQGILSRGTAMEELLTQARAVAMSDVSVVVLGESGTGKELVARAIHRASPRRDAPFVVVDCTAIPENLLESELFGHRKGAFTGAMENREGLLRAAHGGTLFFDEIGDMPLSLQAKLLRALQEREVRPLGATQRLEFDARVLAATHRDLEDQVEKGEFREDLFYRLSVVSLEVPSLDDRREDIPLLANRFLSEVVRKTSGSITATAFSADAMEALVVAPWPGNVRHLRNVVDQCGVLASTSLIPLSLVRKALKNKPATLPSLSIARERFDRDYLIRILQVTKGNVAQAARLASRDRSDLYKLLRRHKLDPEVYRGAGDARED